MKDSNRLYFTLGLITAMLIIFLVKWLLALRGFGDQFLLPSMAIFLLIVVGLVYSFKQKLVVNLEVKNK